MVKTAAPAAPEAPAFSFEDTEVPTVSRTTTKAPNPFTGKIGELKESGKATSFIVPGASSVEKDEKGQFKDDSLRTVIRQLNDAGAEHGVTVRKTHEFTDGRVKLTVWTKERETRTRGRAKLSISLNESAKGGKMDPHVHIRAAQGEVI